MDKNKTIKTLFIIAKGVSSDHFAGQLIRSLKKCNDGLHILGMGGCRMQEAGCEILYNTAPLRAIREKTLFQRHFFFRYLVIQNIRWIEKYKPDAVLILDFPDLVLRLAPVLKVRKISIFYYIVPKIWMKDRKKLFSLKQKIDKIFVLFDFEKTFYEKNGFENVFFFGHPLLDDKKFSSATPAKSIPNGKVIALFPGSSLSEIQKYLPILLKACAQLPDYKFIIASANDFCLHHIKKLLRKKNTDIAIYQHTEKALAECVLAIVVEGLATLECMFMAKPLIVIHKGSLFPLFFRNKLTQMKCISLGNVLAKKIIIPELLSLHCRSSVIVKKIKWILSSEVIYRKMSHEIFGIISSLEKTKVSDNIAKNILKT